MQDKHRYTGASSVEGLQDDQGINASVCEERLLVLGLFNLEEASGRQHLTAYQYLQGGHQKVVARPFTEW